MHPATAHPSISAQGVAGHAVLGAEAGELHTASYSPAKPSLSLADYMAELNVRLRRHPRYLQGKRFPHPQPGSTPILAAALAWEGPWDCVDVFVSVNEDVAKDYDLDLTRSRD